MNPTMDTISNEKLKSLSQEDFALLGANEFVYVKPVEHEGREAYAIFLANGQQVAITPTREAAQVTAGDYDVDILSVH